MADSRADRDSGWDLGSDDRWWDGDGGDAASIASLLVLGLGLASLFGVIPIGPFWAIFAIGFAVVVPVVAILEDRLRGRNADADGAEELPSESDTRRSDAQTDDGEALDAALDRLRDRYARGDLSDEQFESKLEALLETGTPEDARDRVERRRREREREHERERERETADDASE